jgi:hypothetical protein
MLFHPFHKYNYYFCSARDQTQDLMHANQAFYHWALSWAFGFFEIGSHCVAKLASNFQSSCLSLPSVGITGRYHHTHIILFKNYHFRKRKKYLQFIGQTLCLVSAYYADCNLQLVAVIMFRGMNSSERIFFFWQHWDLNSGLHTC